MCADNLVAQVLLHLSFVCLTSASTIPPSAANITLPKGASNHGNPQLLCLPTRWTDIIVFFLGNYIAHAATIVSSPGSSVLTAVISVTGALLAPASGVWGGLREISSMAKFAPTDLQAAARAGALCHVVRVGDYALSLQDLALTVRNSWFSKKIHGRVHLPEGFALATVPRNARFYHDKDGSSPVILCSDYNAVKILAAIGQLLFAATTLYRSRGDQVKRYGYAAFGLTVTQYALMSLMNLLGNLMCAQYPTVYLVESHTMVEARAHPEAVFDGVIGKIVEDGEEHHERVGESRGKLLWYMISRLPLIWAPATVSIIIIWSLTHFSPGTSTRPQRVWVVAWLVTGSLKGAINLGHIPRRKQIQLPTLYSPVFIGYLFAAVPAIGGFTVVAQMLSEYGVCTHL